MARRILMIALLGLGISSPLPAQISRDAKFEILRTVLAEQAASRLALPFGKDGVELSEAGELNKQKLESDIKKNGQSITVGKVVTLTAIAFDDNKVEVELDGGGKNKKGFFEHLEVGVGNTSRPVGDDVKKAKGSKIVLRFAKNVPVDLTPDQLRHLLDPVLDFNKQSFLKTGLESLPIEFQEAVKVKEARIGMDRNTVIMALGRPDRKVREKLEGVETEDWLFYGHGVKTLFITFEDNVVVRIRQY